MRRALFLPVLVLLGACASLNTPAQDLAWDRWQECKRFQTIKLGEIRPDGQIWVTFRDPSDLAGWQQCEREAWARQQRQAQVPAPPPPAPEVRQTPVAGRAEPAAAAPRRVTGAVLSPDDFRGYYGSSWAVAIGIDAYQSQRIPRLSYAVADAESIARALPGLGFAKDKIVVLKNTAATKAAIERAIYGSRSQMTRDDRLFVFFAGHGETLPIRGGHEGYLLPFDTDPSNLPLTALPMTELAHIGRRLPPKHVLFALDTCFSGYAARRDIVPSVLGADLQALTREPVVQILTAGTQGQRALEEGGHGIFTKHLLKGLEGWADPEGNGLTALKLATFVQERVIRESSGQQTPQYGKLEGEGEFLFRPPRR